MGICVEREAKNVEEAVALALEELNTDESKVDIEVLDQGNKGFLGIIGNKMARVKVTVKETVSDKVNNFLGPVFEKMKIDVEMSLKETDNSIYVKLKGKDIGVVIGRRGETLDSLQYLTSLAINKDKESFKRVVIDVENYRQKREETLVKLAKKLCDRVVKYKKNVTLEPMNPYERRIIHSTLQNNKFVQTYSVGEEPNRKVVIKLK